MFNCVLFREKSEVQAQILFVQACFHDVICSWTAAERCGTCKVL